MDNLEMVMTVGILKGVQSQTTDTDVKIALNKCIDIYGKLLQGYELIKPEPADAPEEETEGGE